MTAPENRLYKISFQVALPATITDPLDHICENWEEHFCFSYLLCEPQTQPQSTQDKRAERTRARQQQENPND